jgi:pimeloyl-ACP methyl ester carboxylesterase
MKPEPFRIEIPDSVLNDLRDRIRRTRWPDQAAGIGWEAGSDLATVRALLARWGDVDGFDWRLEEERLNVFPHFVADVEGLRVHFLHERGEASGSLPLVLTHGWPGTFVEMTRLLPLLTRPSEHGGRAEDAFDVVVPSLPGFGFSGIPREPGMTKTRIARMWAALMRGLGYERFGARGGDIGAGVTTWLAVDHPDRVAGIHLSDVVRPNVAAGPEPTAAERRFLEEERAWIATEGGYDHIQATKPQSLAYGLMDSPAGLAGWLLEKYRSWSDCHGNLQARYSQDDLLTVLTIYWATGTIHSANRLYFDRDREPRSLAPGQRVPVPAGFTMFPGDIDHPPREFAERAYDVRRWSEMPRGGHFAAWEEPELLAQELREFFRPLR